MAVKSILRYPGGKGRVLPKLLSCMPDGIEDWREPFFGGGSVTLGFLQSSKSKDCKKFVVGDLYPEVYSMWKAIQQCPNEVAQKVYEYMGTWCPTHEAIVDLERNSDEYKAGFEQAIKEGKAFWDWASNVDCNTLSLAERAARFIIINRTSFSGMGDSGSMTNDQLMGFKSSDVERVYELSRLLQPVEILNASYEVTMSNVDKEKTFVFLDPPYYNQAKTPMYGKKGNMHKGFPHEAFAEFTKQLDCKWLITYDDSVMVRKMYYGCKITPFRFAYTMAGNTAEDALAGEEVLISNYYSESVDDAEDEEGNDGWL